MSMTLREIAESLKLEVKTAAGKLDGAVTGAYVSDLLSDVIANSKAGEVWVTLQIHENVIAVASLKELAGIILIGGRELSDEVSRKAEAEGIPVMGSRESAFQVAGKLYELGIR